ncbi:MAG: S9 family peptidase [Bacillota bacterium]|nr:S9 family peptidase [Bacillota bacterium]
MSKRPVTAEDLLRIKFLGQVAVSPDGRRAAYVVTTTDRDKDAYRSTIHLLDLASGESRPFTAGNHKDSQPQWSPDGHRIAFLSDRSGKNQIWLIDTGGGEAQQLTRLAKGVGDPVWSPDGEFLAFTSRVKTGEEPAEESKEKDKEKDKERDKDKSDVRVITRLKYKANGIGFLGDERQHVFIVSAAGGPARQITFGECDDENPAWSPDGKTIAFTGNRTEDADYTNVRDVHVVSVLAGEPRQVSRLPGPASLPQWSADGKLIYFVGHDNVYRGATHTTIWSIPVDGGDAARLTDADLAAGSGVTWDMTPGPTGRPYRVLGDWIYFSAASRGECHLFRTPAAGGAAEPLTAGPRHLVSFSVSADGGAIVCAIAGPTDSGQVFALKNGEERKLTDLNADLFAELDLAVPEEFTFPGAGGLQCQGWLLRPPGFQDGRNYPAILEIHGGPHAMYGYGLFHEMQLLAAKGYVVVYTNPRGSQGYGQEFTEACRGDWGGKDYEDLMLGMDAAIARGFIDTSRIGVTGGSYGGFMTAWVVGHTNRFKAAVTQRPVTNRYSFYGTSDIGPLFGESEFPGNPWDNHDLLYERSPVHYVKNIRTPLLIVHSEEDYRCPIEQAEQLFVFLKRMRRTVEFVRFPGENHELSRSGKPKHRLERLARIAGWFERHL